MSEKNKSAVAVSACLLGERCRYDGKANFCEKVIEYVSDKTVIKICPEVAGGLTIPREPCEIKKINGEKRVVTISGIDVTAEFTLGAAKSLSAALDGGAKLAVLKEASPSCGSHEVHDGNFCGKKISGQGITAELFNSNGIKTISEKEL